MKNPFDKDTDQFYFFNEMTEAIDKFMIHKYPNFHNQLNDIVLETKTMLGQFRAGVIDQRKELEAIKERHLNFITAQVNEFLKKEYPDLNRSLTLKQKEFEKLILKHEKNVEMMANKLNKVIKSDSLYEDVYKMRDEFKEMKKFMDSFSKKIKKAFEV